MQTVNAIHPNTPAGGVPFDQLNVKQPDNLIYTSTVQKALSVAIEIQASDVHISEGNPPWIRHGGTFRPLPESNSITSDEARIVMSEWGNGPDTSVTITLNDSRWRLTCYEATDGIRASFRRVPSFPPQLEKLGLPGSISDLLDHTDGLIITAGATGAGKTTTLASLVNRINQTRSLHILTIEDPIEYQYPQGSSMISQRDVPIEEQKTALKTALRSDPDIVFLGECRLPEHFDLCLTLAATGHLVFTSVHARDASSACQRVATATGDTGRSALAQTLRAIISQRLIPDVRDRTMRHVAAEVMINNPAMQQAIRPDGDITSIQRILRDEQRGMDRVLVELVRNGRITADDARNEALDVENFDYLLKHLSTQSKEPDQYHAPRVVQRHGRLVQLG